ncbi:hypothetical protein RRF57_012212 [Xylaria bambusicola]|uniref:Uncharacterized protein n=1 Tax=Xylaria bambusicola TaxID=326684 RepID=A0AAN7Z4C2_9PEZI
MTRQEYEDSLRDSGLPENEIRIAMGPKPTKIIGRPAKEVRAQSGVVKSVEAPAAPPKNPRGRKRATGTPADNGAAPAKKRRANAKGKGKAIVPAASLPTPSLSPPFASGMSPASAIDVDDDNYVAPGSTRAAAIDLDSDDDTPLFAPRSPSIDELEMALMEEQASALPKSPTLSSMSPAAEASTTDDAPPSPTLSQLEAALLEEESALAEAATEAPDSLTSSGADDVVDSHDDAPAVAPESPSIAELEEALLEELFLEAVEFVSDEEGDV